jgi:hypothetical protein
MLCNPNIHHRHSIRLKESERLLEDAKQMMNYSE